MTQEEKAQAYDEALERARKMLNMILDNELLGFPDQIREIFPQLAGSEDEKIIQNLIDAFTEYKKSGGVDFHGIRVNTLLAWLGKQKEQKPADLSEMMVHKEPYIAPVPTPMVADEQKQEWSEEDEKMLQSIIKDFRDGNISSIGQEQWLKSLPERFNLQSKQEWSEEDDRNLDRAIFYVRHYQRTNGVTDGSKECLDWLKSLRSQQISRPNINRTVWHSASEEKPTKLPIIHIWYHGNRVDAVVAHENIGLQEELNDINFQPDDKWAYVEDLLNAQSYWKPSVEQMKAFTDFIIGNEYDAHALAHLWAELKELSERLIS